MLTISLRRAGRIACYQFIMSPHRANWLNSIKLVYMLGLQEGGVKLAWELVVSPGAWQWWYWLNS